VKNFFKRFVFIAIVAIIGLSMITCGSGLGGVDDDELVGGTGGGGTGTGGTGGKTGGGGGSSGGGGGGSSGGGGIGGGGGSSGGVSGETPTGKNVIVMDAAMLNSKLESISNYGSYESTLTFNNLEAKYMPAPGDIINAGISTPAPDGFLYKVKSVSTSDGKTVITTEMATLEDAIENADFTVEDFDLEFEGDDDEVEVEAVVRSAISRAAGSASETKKTERINVKKTQVSPNASISGSMQISAKINCAIKIEDWTMQRFKLSTTPRLQAKLTAEVSGKIEKEIEFDLGTYPLPSISFWVVPVYVVIKPRIKVTGIISTTGEVKLTGTLVDWDYSREVGVEYTKSSKWKTINADKSQPAKYLEDVQIDLEAELKVGPKVNFDFGLYGVAYTGITVGLYAKLAGEKTIPIPIGSSPTESKLSLLFGFELGLEASLEILGKTVAEYSPDPFFTKYWTIWERSWKGTAYVVFNQTSWTSAINLISTGGANKTYTIFVTRNFSMQGVTSPTFGTVSGLNVTITGDHTITLTGTGSLLRVAGNQTVVIHDTDFVGNSDNNNYLVYMTNVNSSLTMEGNSSVSGNTFTAYVGSGSGVYVTYGTFTMKDSASIHDNNAIASYARGAGVQISNGGTFTMAGGEIKGNNAVEGGGVYMSDGTFNMTGGTISGNTAWGGGGVYMYSDGGTFTMTGGTISGNTSNDNNPGGGVYVSNGTFRMAAGTIYGRDNPSLSNITTGSGTALYVKSGATAQRGFFAGPTWTMLADLSTTSNTVKVANGVLQ